MTEEIEVIQYQVRSVPRYVVTRYERAIDAGQEPPKVRGGSEMRGEYDNAEVAYEVAYALCKAEHDHRGWPVGDERIQYPERLNTERFDITQRAKAMAESLDLPYGQYRTTLEAFLLRAFFAGSDGAKWSREPFEEEGIAA